MGRKRCPTPTGRTVKRSLSPLKLFTTANRQAMKRQWRVWGWTCRMQSTTLDHLLHRLCDRTGQYRLHRLLSIIIVTITKGCEFRHIMGHRKIPRHSRIFVTTGHVSRQKVTACSVFWQILVWVTRWLRPVVTKLVRLGLRALSPPRRPRLSFFYKKFNSFLSTFRYILLLYWMRLSAAFKNLNYFPNNKIKRGAQPSTRSSEWSW